MADFAIKIENADKVAAAFRNYPSIAEPIFQKAVIGSQFVMQKFTLKGDPVPWRTGNLLMSFRFQAGRLFARWFPTANYAVFVHEGTSRGIQPNRFMPTIAERSRFETVALFQEALDIIGEEVAKQGK